MFKKLFGFSILITIGILAAGCLPATELMGTSQTIEVTQGVEVSTTEMTSETNPTQKTQSVPTVIISVPTDLSTAVISTRDLPTPISTPVEKGQPEAFLIFGLAGPAKDSADGSVIEEYEQAVITAVTTDLAQRKNIMVYEISIETIEQTEIQRAAPCGNEVEKTDSLNDGLSVGYEITLTANETTHRYIAMGGLAYYCSQ